MRETAGVGTDCQTVYCVLSKSPDWREENAQVLSGRRDGRFRKLQGRRVVECPDGPGSRSSRRLEAPPTEKLGPTLSRFQTKADEGIRLGGATQDAEYWF